MPSLRSSLSDLASTFATSVLTAIRGASLEELVGEASAGARRGPGRPKAVSGGIAKPARAARSGRLQRRSPEDIANALASVVALVKKHKDGLRAEQIRKTLRMQSKEMPRVISEGLAKKVLRKRGQKRATTYTAS